MRRGLWIVVGAAAALVLLLGAAVLVLRSGVFDDRVEPRPSPGPTYADGTLTPQEQTVTVRPQRDGSLAVSVNLVFDAGPGTDRPVTWITGPAQLGWVSDERRAQFWVQPIVDGVTAQAVDPGRPAESLAVTSTRPDRQDPFLDATTYRFAPPQPWAAGRHRVQIDYTLRSVHVEADGTALLALPLGFPAGPLGGQTRDVTRVAITGSPVLSCPATNTTFAERQGCPGAPGRQVYRTKVGEGDQVEALVFDPAGVTTAPAPMPQREVR